MKLQTSITPRRDGTITLTAKDGQRCVFAAGPDGELVGDVTDEATVTELLAGGMFFPADPADFDAALALTGAGENDGDGDGDDEGGDDDEGDDGSDGDDSGDGAGSLPLEANTPPKPPKPRAAAKTAAKTPAAKTAAGGKGKGKGK